MFVTPTFTGIFQNTGSVIIPAGTRAFNINVVSGFAYVNDALYVAGSVIPYSAADSKCLLGSPIVVGVTGFGPNRTTVFYAV